MRHKDYAGEEAEEHTNLRDCHLMMAVAYTSAPYRLAPLLLCGILAFPVSPAAQNPKTPVRDPHTPGFVAAQDLADGMLPSASVDGNFVIGTTHTAAPATHLNSDIPHGRVVTLTMTSGKSSYYPGIARDDGPTGYPDPHDPARIIVTTSHAAPWTRTVAVYIPAQYEQGTVSPLIVGADGPDPQLFTVLDNLIAAHKLPAMIAVSIEGGGGHAEGSERGLEYDTVSGRYAEFVEHEVLPFVERSCDVRLTHDPDARAAMGVASGGSASFAMAWFHPELYHRVISYSGTFINQQWPHNPALPHGAWEYHEHLISDAARKPLRIWMEEGDHDLFNPNTMRDGMHDWVIANERMAEALHTKGYHYQFVFARDSGPGDEATKAQTLPEALEYVWQGYPSVQRP